jgi:hypothetical protein
LADVDDHGSVRTLRGMMTRATGRRMRMRGMRLMSIVNVVMRIV